jgi:hypothetical protein
MITWAELTGKLIEFILSKIAARELESRLDKKKSRVRAFLGLHESLLILENATTMFVAQTQTVTEGTKPRLFMVPLKAVAKEVDRGSQLFFKSLGDLHSVISIYDPILARLLWGIHDFKFTIVDGLARALKPLAQFKITPNSDSVFLMEFLSPSFDNIESELDQWYLKMSDWNDEYLPHSLVPRGAESKWKEHEFRERLKSLSKTERLAANDVEMLVALAKRLEAHISVLSNARSELSRFIRENFVIGDLLGAEL